MDYSWDLDWDFSFRKKAGSGGGFVSAGLVAWYDFSDNTALNLSSTSINAALDKSGNGNNTGTQTTTKRPTATVNQQNSLQTGVFVGGSAQTLSLPSALYTIPAGANTIFVVAARTTDISAVASMVSMGTTTSNNNYGWYFTDSGGQIDFVSGGQLKITGAPVTSYNIYTGSYDGTTGTTLQVNNGVIVTSLAGSVVGSIAVGEIGSTGDTTSYLSGAVGEVLIYNRKLTTSETAQINSYLLTKWGITTAAQSLTSVSGYDVIPLFLQSNMIGRNGNWDYALDATNALIAQWGRFAPVADTITLAYDPLQHVDPTGNTVGPGMSLAKAYVTSYLATGRGVLLVPCAQGGTGYSNGYWNPGDALYTSAVARVNAAVAAQAGNRIVACIFQGLEADYLQTQAYCETHIDAMVAQMRIDMNIPNVPFIFGEPLIGGAQTTTANVNALAGTPTRDYLCGYTPSTGLVGGGDNLHFTAPSCRSLGASYLTTLQTNFAPLFYSGLTLWHDMSDVTAMTKAYQNITATGTGVSTTNTITASVDVTSVVKPGMIIRIGGTDIYTVSTVSTTTITTTGALTATYLAGSALALQSISQINDKSGNLFHSTQATASKQPVYNPAKQNSLGVAEFNGANTMVMNSGIGVIPRGAHTIFCVTKRDADINSIELIYNMGTGGTISRNAMFFANIGQAIYRSDAGASSNITLASLTTNAYHLYRGTYDGAVALTFDADNNATSGSNSSGVVSSDSTSFFLGSRSDTQFYLVGSICELIMFNRLLTSTEQAAMETYLKTKWATP